MATDAPATPADAGLPPGAGSSDDLSPLAWVYGELRRSLETANRALRRYRREADAIGESDVDVVDPSVLRTARAQLHQGVGALDLVGLPEAARVLRASEAAVQRMVVRPVLADAAAIAAVEQMSFALLDYLARQLAGKPVSPVRLFPQYRAVQQLAGADRVHPADLWRQGWRWESLQADPAATPRAADDDARSDMESLVLPLMRQPEPVVLARMSDLCAGLGAGARAPAAGSAGGVGTPLATFWYLAAAVFEAQAGGLLASDVFNKRIASRLLAQLRLGVDGHHQVSDRLAQDMLFFCAHAKAASGAVLAPRLDAVRRAWQLDDQASDDYEMPSLGRFDPAQVALARKRVAAATEAWSSACGGELFRLPGLAEQFSLVGDSLQRLFPAGAALSQALQAVMTDAAAVHQAPPATLAMEVATSMLYLDASLEDGNLDDPDLPGRLQQLGQRIDQVREGGEPQPLQAWMEDLYRRVSDRQTMGSVVQELRASLSEVEKQIDLYFRDPAQRSVLIPVPSQLQAMRGVLTVLGMGQASQAVMHMSDEVDALAQTEVDPQRAIQTGTFDRLADNLGALSFLIDMLSVQPALAKSLFRYDPATGSLSAVMGQSERVSAFAGLGDEMKTVVLPARAAPLAAAVPAAMAAPTKPPGPSGLEDDAEMRGIFVDEALEVVADARACLARLADHPDHAGDMTAMRRAFHTLKGSARMVGLGDFGDAAWSCEQLYNSRLAQATHMDAPLRQFTSEALTYLGAWTQALAAGVDDAHASGPVTLAADALRLQGVHLSIAGADEVVIASAPADEGFLLDFDPIDEVSVPAPAAAADRTLSLTERIPDLPSAADLDLGLPELDLPPIDAPPALTPAAAAEVVSFDLDLADLDDFRDEATVVPPAPAPPLDLVLDDAPSAMEVTQVLPVRAPTDEEQVRVIGPLRIGIPLFNIFLNEADELSRRLVTELAEWALEHERHPVSAASAVLAHSLAGNSATVGYAELSALARALEHALVRSNHAGPGQPGEPELFSDAAEEIRRLLHQFAAGFLRSVQPGLMERLAEHERLPAPALQDSESDAPADLAAVFTAAVHQPALPQADSRFVSLPAGPAGQGARAAMYGDDDDIDAVDDIDVELFPIFDEEASELLLQLQTRLHEWRDQPAEAAAAASACMRTLHTFKGGARLAGAMRLGEMAHRLEAAIEHQLSLGDVQATDVERLLARADAMQATFEAVRTANLVRERAAAAEPPAAPVVAQPVPVPQVVSVRRVPAAAPARSTGGAGGAAIAWQRFTSGDTGPAAAVERQAGGVASVRVRAGLLDRLVNQAGEVSITRARIDADVRQLQGNLAELGESLDRMRRHLRDIELQAETQISTRLEAAKAAAQAFDPLEMDRFTRFQELTRFMAESVNDVGTLQRGLQRTLQSTEDQLAAQARLTRELQDDLLRTRMVEFESMADRFYRTVRQASKDTGKQVRLDIVGGAIEIDRGVLDRMTAPFEHLLRNSVAHGIEPPDRRAAAGKEAGGRITVTVAQVGNEVAVEFADDGAGLDLARIRQRGIERGLIQPDAPASDAELTRLIFTPGFSTADNVTELAGRGVGMDVVRADVNAMGGRIETASVAGQGTQFRLLLPLTTAVTQVVMLRCGGLHIAVPSSLVEVVRRVGGAEVDAAYESGGYDFNGEAVPFFWMAALLAAGSRGEGAESSQRTQAVVVIRSAAQRVALHVDDVVGNQEVVVKNVGPQLSRMPGLAGVTLLSTGSVALIYNPVALAAVYGESARLRMRQAPSALPDSAQPVMKAPLVLVVDDSLTVRRVTQRLLAREGYRVTLAKDGIEALTRLAEERPAVLLTDIEMPRMDGFDLLRNVRAEPRLAGLPVVMITSRIAQKHRDFAVELGVDHYLGKPFSEDDLLALVARYAQALAQPS
jgi:chemosensory pili system protein ChpA (sensor histidine kinase/response regulator)